MQTNWGRPLFLWTCGLSLVVSCKGSDPAPGVPTDMDGSVVEEDTGPPPPIDCENSVGEQDADGDGFPRARGDCDDCDPKRGPAALEISDNQLDDDCDGKLDEAPPAACDPKLEPDSAEPEEAAHVLGQCESHSQNSRLPGLIEAQWQNLAGENAPLIDAKQVWFPERFGTIPAREGSRLLVLSTGVARDVNDADYTPDCDVLDSMRGQGGLWSGPSQPPGDYPRDSTLCEDADVSKEAPAYNEVVLSLKLRAPTNMNTLAFDSLFLTYEYPDYVCSKYNDFFVALITDPPREIDDDDRFELQDEQVGNVLFDRQGDPIGVNSGLLSVCRKDKRGSEMRPINCEQGPALLQDTGFDKDESICASKQNMLPDIGGASTGWLHTEVPVEPGKVFRLRFMLWDSGDPLLDSTVLIDNLRWLPEQKPIGTDPITGA